MKRWMTIGSGVAGALAIGAVGTTACASARWQRATARAVDRMRTPASSHAVPPPARFSVEELAGVPAPVERYFRFALIDGQPGISRAWLRSTGDFLGNPPDGWSTFTAQQHVSIRPYGFVWDASIRMMPVVPVRVRDGYVEGGGMMHAKVGGLVTVIDLRDTPEMAAGSLLRYLAEATWYPTALLPSADIRWDPLDDRSARVTLRDGETTVALDVFFGDQGEIIRVWAMRHREVDGTMVLTPWEGTFSDYRRLDGMMVPARGEVAWLLPDGPQPYWRGRIIEARYQFAGARP